MLWPERDYANPRRALRTAIYRLRHLFPDDGRARIVFSQGCYRWEGKDNDWLDTVEFTRLLEQASSCIDNEESINYLQKAIALYQGDYLPESAYCEWAIPTRHYYRRLYLEAVQKLISLLQKQYAHQEIIKICEKTFAIEPFEEDIHLAYLKSLLSCKKIQQARVHYQYATTMLYKNLGVKPSPALRAVYQQIQAGNILETAETDGLQIELAQTSKTQGAFYCQWDFFCNLLNLERRRAERTGHPVMLVLLKLACENIDEEYQRAQRRFIDSLVNNLRKGDVVSQKNEHIALLLPGLNNKQAETLLGRIRKQCFSQLGQYKFTLKINMETLLAAQSR